MSDSYQPHGLQPTRLLHPWDFPGKSTGVGCHIIYFYFIYQFIIQVSYLIIQYLLAVCIMTCIIICTTMDALFGYENVYSLWIHFNFIYLIPVRL